MVLPLKRKSRSVVEGGGDVVVDDDDDDDDLLFQQHSAATNKRSCTLRRRMTTIEIKKQKQQEQRMKLLNNALQTSTNKIQRDVIIDELHQSNNLKISSTQQQQTSSSTSSSPTKNNQNKDVVDGINILPSTTTTTTTITTLFQNDDSTAENNNVKATTCLGSRTTIQYMRTISLSSTTTTTTVFTVPTTWTCMEKVVNDLQHLLLYEIHQLKEREVAVSSSSSSTTKSSIISLCNHLLQHAATTQVDCVSYLQDKLLCRYLQQQQQLDVTDLPVSIIHWLMTLSCCPIIMMMAVDDTDTNSNNKKQDDINIQNLKQAKHGAYKTLCQLLLGTIHSVQFQKQQLQKRQNKSNKVLILSALIDQLRQWYGSKFPLHNNSNKDENKDPSDIVQTQQQQSTRKQEEQYITVITNHDSIIRFLHLWTLALQHNLVKGLHYNMKPMNRNNKNNNNNNERDAIPDKKDISNTILAVLWIGLDPVFAFGKSAKIDGYEYIIDIVVSLLNAGCQLFHFHKQEYQKWIDDISTQLYETWTKHLGPGLKGTDANEDVHAWLSLSRTIQRFGDKKQQECWNVDDNDKKRNNGTFTEEGIVTYLQLSLARCVLSHSWNNDDMDCISKAATDFLNEWKVPNVNQDCQCWQGLAYAATALRILETNFPDDDPPKCLAIIEISTVCFQSGIVTIQSACLESKRRSSQLGNGGAVGAQDDDASMVTDPFEATPYFLDANDALYAALDGIEESTQKVSQLTRGRLMQSKCFPLASSLVESMRVYARVLKKPFAPRKTGIGSFNQQARLDSFFNISST